MHGKLKSLFVINSTTLRSFLVFTALMVGFGMSVQAEVVKIPISQQGADIETPHTGVSQESVLSKFGEPDQRTEPVGVPPISRWIYPNFTVYFEYDHVITSVIHKK